MTAFSGYAVYDDYADEARAADLLSSIEAYLGEHEPRVIHREHGGRGLRYSVIDGVHVKRHLHELVSLYAEVNEFVDQLMGVHMVPMRNELAGLNVNVTPPGGSYRWHYDRNVVTAMLYLNRVVGGEIEVCPNYRVSRGNDTGRLGRAGDRLLQVPLVLRAFGRKVSVAPQPGSLVVLRGNRCLHSVRPVGGTQQRVNVVMAFDDANETLPPAGDELDTYLYSSDEVRAADPNYRTS